MRLAIGTLNPDKSALTTGPSREAQVRACLPVEAAGRVLDIKCDPSLQGREIHLLRAETRLYWSAGWTELWEWPDGDARPRAVLHDLTHAIALRWKNGAAYVLDEGQWDCVPGDSLCGLLGEPASGRVLQLQVTQDGSTSARPIGPKLVRPSPISISRAPRANSYTIFSAFDVVGGRVLIVAEERGESDVTHLDIRALEGEHSHTVTRPTTGEPVIGLAADRTFVYFVDPIEGKVWRKRYGAGPMEVLGSLPYAEKVYVLGIAQQHLLVAIEAATVSIANWDLSERHPASRTVSLTATDLRASHVDDGGLVLGFSSRIDVQSAPDLPVRTSLELQVSADCPEFSSVGADAERLFASTTNGCIIAAKRGE